MSLIENGTRECTGVCDTHGAFTTTEIYAAGEWRGGICPLCFQEYENSERTQRIKDKRAAAIGFAMKKAGIPKRFQGKSFDSYIPGNDKGKRKALTICKGYAENFDKVGADGASLVMCGKPGTGKTHLACSIGNHLIANSYTVCFIGAVGAVRRVKETYSNKSQETERSVINHFVDMDLLILDEIGVQFGTDAEKLILFEIINQRYETMRPTIVISNLLQGELAAYVGERVMDRLSEGGGPVLAFDWESYR